MRDPLITKPGVKLYWEDKPTPLSQDNDMWRSPDQEFSVFHHSLAFSALLLPIANRQFSSSKCNPRPSFNFHVAKLFKRNFEFHRESPSRRSVSIWNSSPCFLQTNIYPLVSLPLFLTRLALSSISLCRIKPFCHSISSLGFAALSDL